MGTRQGCTGRPKLFSLFINDLIKYLELKRNHGISVSTEISDFFSHTVIGLQCLLNEIGIFCKLLELKPI